MKIRMLQLRQHICECVHTPSLGPSVAVHACSLCRSKHGYMCRTGHA